MGRPRGALFLVFSLLVVALATWFVACGDDDDDGAEPTSTPTPAASVAPTATPTQEPATGTEYPVTVTDMLGREVTIDAAPESVAALSPTTVEFVYAVGGTSLTRSSSVQYPEEAASAEDVGSSYQPNLEIIASVNPDLIVADSMLQPQLLEDLEALGVPVVYAGVAVWEDVATGLQLIGEVLDKSDQAGQAVAELDATKDDITSKLPADAATVLILNGTPDDFYAAKPESYAGNLVETLGSTNVAAGAPDVGQFPGYTQLSLESIVAAEPDVVLAITAGPPGGQTITEALSTDAAWATVPAVQNGRVSEISAELFLQAPGPRAGEALLELATLIYPDIYAQ
jgi:iron complex transport system substrate-binding protein